MKNGSSGNGEHQKDRHAGHVNTRVRHPDPARLRGGRLICLIQDRIVTHIVLSM
jgi:hypothetical protein